MSWKLVFHVSGVEMQTTPGDLFVNAALRCQVFVGRRLAFQTPFAGGYPLVTWNTTAAIAEGSHGRGCRGRANEASANDNYIVAEICAQNMQPGARRQRPRLIARATVVLVDFARLCLEEPIALVVPLLAHMPRRPSELRGYLHLSVLCSAPLPPLLNMLPFWRPLIRVGDLILANPSSLVSSLVKLQRAHPVSHAALVTQVHAGRVYVVQTAIGHAPENRHSWTGPRAPIAIFDLARWLEAFSGAAVWFQPLRKPLTADQEAVLRNWTYRLLKTTITAADYSTRLETCRQAVPACPLTGLELNLDILPDLSAVLPAAALFDLYEGSAAALVLRLYRLCGALGDRDLRKWAAIARKDVAKRRLLALDTAVIRRGRLQRQLPTWHRSQATITLFDKPIAATTAFPADDLWKHLRDNGDTPADHPLQVYADTLVALPILQDTLYILAAPKARIDAEVLPAPLTKWIAGGANMWGLSAVAGLATLHRRPCARPSVDDGGSLKATAPQHDLMTPPPPLPSRIATTALWPQPRAPIRHHALDAPAMFDWLRQMLATGVASLTPNAPAATDLPPHLVLLAGRTIDLLQEMPPPTLRPYMMRYPGYALQQLAAAGRPIARHALTLYPPSAVAFEVLLAFMQSETSAIRVVRRHRIARTHLVLNGLAKRLLCGATNSLLVAELVEVRAGCRTHRMRTLGALHPLSMQAFSVVYRRRRWAPSHPYHTWDFILPTPMQAQWWVAGLTSLVAASRHMASRLVGQFFGRTLRWRVATLDRVTRALRKIHFAPGAEALRDMFNVADRNHDGQLSVDELLHFVHLMFHRPVADELVAVYGEGQTSVVGIDGRGLARLLRAEDMLGGLDAEGEVRRIFGSFGGGVVRIGGGSHDDPAMTAPGRSRHALLSSPNPLSGLSLGSQGSPTWQTMRDGPPPHPILTAAQLGLYLSSLQHNNAVAVREDACVPDDRPLAAYYVLSSHNTYLAGNQLTSHASAEQYVRLLRIGCRCLEIDAWDGPGGAPCVTHGYTLTTKISFFEVVCAIADHAFELTPWPLILSIENHCSRAQQDAVLEGLQTAFRRALLTSTEFRAMIARGGRNRLPAPADLQFRVIVKCGGLPPAIPGTRSLADVVCLTSTPWPDVLARPTEQPRHAVLSITENKLLRIAEDSCKAQALALFAQTNLVRVYPHGLRFDSSNFDPVPAWHLGCQMVALNLQTPGRATEYVQAWFVGYRHAGYVLRDPQRRYVGSDTERSQARGDDDHLSLSSFGPRRGRVPQMPTTHLGTSPPLTLDITLLDARLFPDTERRRVLLDAPAVSVALHGMPPDRCTFKTAPATTVFNAAWGETFHIFIANPAAAVIIFRVVQGQDDAAVLGFSARVLDLRPGVRVVPLFDAEWRGSNAEESNLMVRIRRLCHF